MKHRFLPFLAGLAVGTALLCVAHLIQTVRAEAVTGQCGDITEVRKLHEGVAAECRFQYPHSYLSQAQCYAEWLGRT